MADPYIGAPAIFFFVEATVPQPEATTPATIALGFTGTDGTSGAPQFSFKDDAGTEYYLVAFSVAATGDLSIPYQGDGMYFPSILRMSSDLLYMILNGNLFLGEEDGSGDTNTEIGFSTGASGGKVYVGAGQATDDGNEWHHSLPQESATAENQAAVVRTISGGSNTLGYQTVDVCLAKAVSVDLNSTTKQTLYTVPSGRSCIITKVVQRDASAAVTTATGSYGFNAGASDVIALFNVFTNMTATTVYDPKTVVGPATKGASTNTFGYKGTVAEGTARTMVVDVFGYLL